MNKQEAKKFLKQFKKDEILDVLVGSPQFDLVLKDICKILHQRKLLYVIDEIKRNAGRRKNCETQLERELLLNESVRLDNQLNRLVKKFRKLLGKS